MEQHPHLVGGGLTTMLHIAELHAHELFKGRLKLRVTLWRYTQAAGIDAQVDVIAHLLLGEQRWPLLGALLLIDAVEDAVLQFLDHTDEHTLLHQGEVTGNLGIDYGIVKPVGTAEVLNNGVLATAYGKRGFVLCCTVLYCRIYLQML